MKSHIPLILLLAHACLCTEAVIPAVFAQDEDAGSARYLLGDWSGARSELEEKGIEFVTSFTSDVIGNVRGGVKRGAPYWEHLALGSEIDTQKGRLWPDGTFFILFNGDLGDEPTDYVGDFQWTDSWQGFNNFALMEAWYEHAFLEGRAALRLGLQDLSTDMNVLRYAFPLLNSSFSTNAELAQITPPIYPLSALGTRLRIDPFEEVYLMAGAFDGIPGKPEDYHGTHVDLNKEDGFFSIFEGGLNAGEDADFSAYHKAAFGYWHSSAHFSDFSGRERNHNSGIYFIAEKSIYAEPDPEQGL